VQHLFFTNTRVLPVLAGKSAEKILNELGVKVIKTDFKYKTPLGYYKAWQNQFYEFSILEHIASNYQNPNDMFLILDSDCLFLKSAAEIFSRARSAGGFLSYEMMYPENYAVNGISRTDMKSIYEDLLKHEIKEVPAYHAGEFFLSSQSLIKKLFADFLLLWPLLLEKNEKNEKKLNEEAHTLSFLYFKNDLMAGGANAFIKRIWTNPVFYRNVSSTDAELTIWHLPAEKTYGLPKLFWHFLHKEKNFGLTLDDNEFLHLIQRYISIPDASLAKLSKYYVHTYYNALKKRLIR
jgi:hypothetical protein